MSIKLEKDDLESEYNKIFLGYLKQYIDKSKMKGRLTVRETEDKTISYTIPEYILNTDPPVKIKIITNEPLGITKRYGPIHMSRLIYIVLDMEPGYKRRKWDLYDDLTYYNIEQMDKDSVSEKISLSLNMVACDIIKGIAGFEDTEDIIETDFYDEADFFNKDMSKLIDPEEEKTSDDESTETYEDYKKKNKNKRNPLSKEEIWNNIGKILIILLGLALFMIPIAEAISGFYYYNKHEHNQTASNISINRLYSYDEAQDIINEGRFLQYQDKVPQKIKDGQFLTLEDRKEIARTERQNERSWRQHNQPAKNIRTEEQIREEQQAYNDIITGKYRTVMDRIEAIHQDHRIQNIQAQIERDKFRAAEAARAIAEQEIKSGKYRTVLDRIEATRMERQTGRMERQAEGQTKQSIAEQEIKSGKYRTVLDRIEATRIEHSRYE